MSEIPHNPELQEKINRACYVIKSVLDTYKKPVILCSFGKDSMVMLHMIREWFSKDIPIVFFRLPHFQRKYSFADNVIGNWDLTVHSNIPPIATTITNGNTTDVEIVHHYRIGQKNISVPMGKQSIVGRDKWLCGRDDVMGGPYGDYVWPWDVCLHGHKASDVDPTQGAIPIEADIVANPGAAHMAFPLRTFTDADIWACHDLWNIPFNRLRYGRDHQKVDDREDVFHPDYFPYCAECLNPFNPGTVRCPKTNLDITNVGPLLPKCEIKKLNYIGGQ